MSKIFERKIRGDFEKRGAQAERKKTLVYQACNQDTLNPEGSKGIQSEGTEED